MPLKCYTRPRKNGSKYVNCVGNKSSGKSKPKKGSSAAKQMMADVRASRSGRVSRPPKRYGA